jgi:hypothetical protein
VIVFAATVSFCIRPAGKHIIHTGHKGHIDMNKLYLHLGTPKTGTTAIHFFAQHQILRLILAHLWQIFQPLEELHYYTRNGQCRTDVRRQPLSQSDFDTGLLSFASSLL